MANSIKILFNNFNHIIYAGEILNGKVECTFATGQRIRAIRLEIVGYVKTEWVLKFGMIKKTYSSTETQLNYRCNLIEGNGTIMHIPAGTYIYPFSYELPSTLPSSYEGKYGKICYRIIVTLQPPESKNELEVPFYVVSHLDLNRFPKLKKPFVYKARGDIKFCGYNKGPMALSISLPVTGYAAGQNIYINACIQNLSTINVECVEFKLVRIIKYIGNKPSMGKRHSQDVIASCTEGAIVAHAEKAWTSVLDFPSDCVLNLRSSRLINVIYQLKVQVVLAFPHSNLNVNCPIMLGTIPLRGTGTSLSEEPVAVHSTAPEINDILALENPSLYEERASVSSDLSLSQMHVPLSSDPPSYEEAMKLPTNNRTRYNHTFL